MPARSGQEGSCRAVTGHPPVSCNTSAGKGVQTRCDGIAMELMTVTTKWFRAYELPLHGQLHEDPGFKKCNSPLLDFQDERSSLESIGETQTSM